MRSYFLLALSTGASSLVLRQEPTDVPPNCAVAYTSYEAMDCVEFVEMLGTLTVGELFKLNPDLESCEMEPGKAYCIEALDDTSTAVATTDAEPTPTPTTKATSVTAEADPEATLIKQPHVTEDCTQWYFVQPLDGCQAIVDKFRTFSLEMFYKWNPDVTSDCILLAGVHVCIGVPGTPVPTTTYLPPPGSGETMTPDPDHQPAMPGIIKGCTTWYQIQSGDFCYNIAFNHDVEVADLLAWNSGIDDACGNIIPGFWMCVGVE